MSSGAFDMLISALAGIPCLPSSRYRGRHALFDEAAPGEDAETVAYRQTQAIALCSRCPALARCEDWFDALPPRKRPAGVIAGQLRPSPVGRPRNTNPNPKGTTAP
jgi:hypothetical protein